jgi:hypothetical protein
MANFIRHDLITERLEIARTIGLVTDYRIGQISSVEANLKIWHGTHATEAAVKHYLSNLLDGLIPEHDIIVMPGATEAAGTVAADPAAKRVAVAA